MNILQSGRTPLHAVAASSFWINNERVVEQLMKGGANVNATDKVSYYQFP